MVENVSIAAKAEVPDIDKVIVNADSANGGDGKGTAQDVGSVVQFKVTSKVPAMDGYDTYTYIVNDTMSDGLTAVDGDADGKIDVTITIGGTSYTDFTVVRTASPSPSPSITLSPRKPMPIRTSSLLTPPSSTRML